MVKLFSHQNRMKTGLPSHGTARALPCGSADLPSSLDWVHLKEGRVLDPTLNLHSQPRPLCVQETNLHRMFLSLLLYTSKKHTDDQTNRINIIYHMKEKAIISFSWVLSAKLYNIIQPHKNFLKNLACIWYKRHFLAISKFSIYHYLKRQFMIKGQTTVALFKRSRTQFYAVQTEDSECHISAGEEKSRHRNPQRK